MRLTLNKIHSPLVSEKVLQAELLRERRLMGLLKGQFVDSDRLEGEIKNNLMGLGYEL